MTAAAASSSARVGKRVREDNDAAEPATSTDSSKRPATNRRRRASSDGDDERRRRLSSADYSEDVEEVDERIDYVEDVDDEDATTSPPPRARAARTKRRPARHSARHRRRDAGARLEEASLANRLSRPKASSSRAAAYAWTAGRGRRSSATTVQEGVDPQSPAFSRRSAERPRGPRRGCAPQLVVAAEGASGEFPHGPRGDRSGRVACASTPRKA